MNKKTFCSYPFNTFFLSADGGVKTCCSSRTDIGNINSNTIEEIVQGPLVKDIRQHILQNKWHAACYQCKEIEEHGGESERKHIVETTFDKFKDAHDKTFRLEKIDLRWSNLCNLTCNYCYEVFSSHWANIKGIKINANKETAENKVFEFLEQNKDTIINVNLLGGEPLLQKQNSKLFDLLPDKRYYILTNLSVDLERNHLIEKLLNMKYVEWGISFENIGSKFEYVRHGAKWTTLVNNLKFLKDNVSNVINVHPLYSIYNAYDLCEFYDFIGSLGFINNLFWQNLLNTPGLNVFNQNDKVKTKAIIELEKCISTYEHLFPMDQLQTIKDTLEKTLGKNFNAKLSFIKFLDNLENVYIKNKNHSFKNLWPEIYQDITE